jgi:uncharacterized protein
LEILLPGGGVKQNSRNSLRLNVGFLLNKSVGFSHNFDFDEPTVQIDEDLDVSHLQGAVRFTRTSQGLYAQGRLATTINLECARCLNEYAQVLHVEIGDLFVYPPDDESDPLLVIKETGILDLSGILREQLLLEVPIQPLCTAGCEGLCMICGNRIGVEECEHPEQEIDPRFAILQSLLQET